MPLTRATAATAATAATVSFVSLPMDAPDDMAAVRKHLAAGLPASDILAVFIKTEGNGLDNDWSRPLALRALREVPGWPLDQEPMVVVSGGCEGFTTPHLLLVVRAPGRLVACHAVSPPLDTSEIGTPVQIEATAQAVRQACQAGGLEPGSAAYAHVVAPWLDAHVPRGDGTPVADGAHASKPWSRGASALGAAVVLDGLDADLAARALAGRQASVHGTRCAVTAGATGGRVQVLVLADRSSGSAVQERGSTRHTRPGTAGPSATGQRLRCHVLRDPLDLPPSRGAADAPPVAVLFKGDPPPDGRLRGERLVLLGDSDLHAFRHHRAAMSGLLAAHCGSTRLFIGGGAEHQCPPGGGLLLVVDQEDAW
jgi:cyanuric acid amidohydrolase